MENFKKTISFLDADNHRATIDLEITHRNGYPEFTASGRYLNGGGQVLDEIRPRTKSQKAIINLWKMYHLNGMSAGTPEQERAVKEWKSKGNKYDYSKAVEYLKSINLYEAKHPETGKPYKYGHGWILKQLPTGFEVTLKHHAEAIEKEEAKRESEESKTELTEDEELLKKMEEYGIDEDNLEACKAYMEVAGADDLSDFEESYCGKFADDEEFAREQAEQLELIDDKAGWPNNCIDWEEASSQLMQDYTEQDGHYFRNI